MDPCRSSSAPLHMAAGRRSQWSRRSPHHVPGLPSRGERSGWRLGQYSVIPPLREQWGPIAHREEGSNDGGGQVYTVPGRPTGFERHAAIQQSDFTSPEHHYRHPNRSVVTCPQPIPNPLLSQPLAGSFHPGTILPAYQQMPMAYPMLSYPPMPLLPLINSPLQYVPQLPLQYHLPINHLPVQLPEITELNRSEARPVPRVYPDYQLHDTVCKEVCSQLVESSLHDLVREIVNSCIDDIVRSYLDSSHLLLHTERVQPHTERVQPHTKRVRPHNKRALPLTRRVQPVVLGVHTHMPHRGGRNLREKDEHGVPVKPHRGEARLLKLQSNSELSHYAATWVLDELLFCQLLEALTDGGRELAVNTQANHILNGLMFDALLQRLC